jgi:membrane protease YdiL (CAAX protease family)
LHWYTILTVLPDPPQPIPDAAVLTEPAALDAAPIRRLSRGRAVAEVIMCSGYPTQLAIVAGLAAVGIRPASDGTLSPEFIFAVSAVDTALLLGLVFAFLSLSNDDPRDLFLGHRRIASELGVGLLTVPAIFLTVVALQIGLRLFAPYLHNVPVNPFASLLGSPLLLAGFIALVFVAGGLREELQRAFLLRRFEQRLGGAWVGLIVTSAAFGLGHSLQGWDAMLVTGMLGACWGAIYLARRSVVATVTSHALFNVAQVAVGYAALVRA